MLLDLVLVLLYRSGQHLSILDIYDKFCEMKWH